MAIALSLEPIAIIIAAIVISVFVGVAAPAGAEIYKSRYTHS
jgi:hypothetical protein